jgi:hypothetical protein
MADNWLPSTRCSSSLFFDAPQVEASFCSTLLKVLLVKLCKDEKDKTVLGMKLFEMFSRVQMQMYNVNDSTRSKVLGTLQGSV